ncbi:MAG: hypothetical protein ACR2LK_01765 [Solirubrobacteraceae bacterium]
MLAALALCAAGPALAQMPELPEDTPGLSPQSPVPLDGDGGPESGSESDPDSESPEAAPTADGELANTGADTLVLLLAGVMFTLLGVALRLRTADAEPH